MNRNVGFFLCVLLGCLILNSSLQAEESGFVVVPQMGHAKAPHSLFFFDDNRYLATFDYDVWHLWDTASGKVVYRESTATTKVLPAPNGEFWIIQREQGRFPNITREIFYKPTDKLKPLLANAQRLNPAVMEIVQQPLAAITPDSRRLVLVSKRPQAQAVVMDLASQEIIWNTHIGMESFVKEIGLSQDGRELFVYSEAFSADKPPYRETRVVAMTDGNILRQIADRSPIAALEVARAGGDYFPDRHHLVKRVDGEIVWSVDMGAAVAHIRPAPQPDRILVILRNGGLQLRAADNGSLIHRFSEHPGEFTYVLSAGDRYLITRQKTDASTTFGNRLSIWDMAQLKPVHTLDGEYPQVANGGRTLLFSRNLGQDEGFDTSEYLYDFASARSWPLPKNAHALGGADNSLVFGGSLETGEFYLYDIRKESITKQFRVDELIDAEPNQVTALSFTNVGKPKAHLSPGGDWAFIFANRQKTYYLLDLIRGKLAQTFSSDAHYLMGFTDDYPALLATTFSGGKPVVARFDLTSQKWTHQARLPGSTMAESTYALGDRVWVVTAYQQDGGKKLILLRSDTLETLKSLPGVLPLHQPFLANDGKHFYTREGATLQLRRFLDGEVMGEADAASWGLPSDVWRYFPHCRPCRFITFLRGLDLIFTTGSQVRVFGAGEGHLASLAGNDRDWLAVAPDGTFSASPNGVHLVAVRSGLKAYGIEQFAPRLNRPDILLERLGNADPDRVDFYRQRHFHRQKQLGLNTKVMELSEPPEVNLSRFVRKGDQVSLTFSAKDRNHALESFSVFINDVPVKTGDLSDKEVNQEVELELVHRRNLIEVSVRSSTGLESLRDSRLELRERDEPGDLFYLGFGVSSYARPELNLQFAHKDALDLEAVFRKMDSTDFRKVHSRVLTDAAVTPQAIEEASSFLRQARPSDTVVLFVAGHGVHDLDGNFFYITHQADPDNLPKTSASFESIELLLAQTPARRKLFLIDTCESGEQAVYIDPEIVTQAGSLSMKARSTRALRRKNTQLPPPRPWLLEKDRFLFADLRRRTGAIVFSSSRGHEFSFESSSIANGFFTEAILEALTTLHADLDQNGSIDTDELRQYVSARVSKLTGGRQNPTVDRDNLQIRFDFKPQPQM